MFSSLESQPHAVKKKRISNIYSKSYLQNTPDMEAITAALLQDRLLPILSAHSTSGMSLDIMPIHQALAVDSATAYFFGLQNGTNFLQDAEARQDWLNLYLRSRPRDYMFYLQELPRITRWLEKVGLHLVPPSREGYNDMVDAWCLNMCDRAESTMLHGNDTTPGNNPVVYKKLMNATLKEGVATDASIFLNSFKSEKDTNPFSSPEARNCRSPQQLEVASELLDQVIATHETIGITLTYVCWELSRHPQIQQRLRSEITSFDHGSYFIQRSRDGTTSGLPNAKLIDELPVLHSVLMETLRLHPAVPGGQPRFTPAEGCVKLGKHSNIPGGVRVSAYAWNLHKNPEVFPDPLGWHPGRWIPGEEARSWQGSDGKDRWFWAFGSGGRMCIGSNFAMQSKYHTNASCFAFLRDQRQVKLMLTEFLVMKFIVAAMYANFETRIVDDEGIEQANGFIAGPKSDRLVLSIHSASSTSSS